MADFGVTQFFFRVDDYLRMIDELAALGVTKPVVPGIMPIENLGGIQRMARMSGAPVPPEVMARFAGYEDAPEDVRRIGVEVAAELCESLLAEGAPGLHFYTLNRSTSTREIYAQLGLQGSVA
jgi:methylenetetrahydrofolate reductase (NADPH)